MPRIRSIKPEFFTSETIAALPLSARLTFIGLWTYVDDNGVGLDNELLITAAVWPLEETAVRIREDLVALAEKGLVKRYGDARRRYLFITSWDEHQKVAHPSKPRYPRPGDPECRRAVKPETASRRWHREELTLPLDWTALYRMWDALGRLLYVGITGNPIERWRRHAQKAQWWSDVHEITYETFPKEHLALEAERRAIREEQPAFNIRSVVA